MKMKIGLVCPYNMFQFAGGVQEVVLQLQKNLNARGHKVLIITPRPSQPVGNIPDGIITVGKSRKVNSPFATMVDWGLDTYANEIDDVLEREKFDVLNFHEPWQPFLPLQIMARSKCVNVATFHAKLPDTIVSRSLLNMLLPYTTSALKYIDIFTAVSSAAASYVETLTKEPINIIPNGIDLDRFKPMPKKPSKKKTIFFIGRLEKRKGIKYLIQAFGLLHEQHKDVQLIIGGNGVDRQKLEKLVKDLNIPDVSFIGFVPEADKLKLISDADIFCSPAIYGESFGIVLLEGMALGTPMVAGNNPGYEGVMTGRGRLSLVSPQNVLDFSQRLELILYDEPIRKLLIDWGFEHVKQFTFENAASGYEAVYKKALKNYGKK
jgi:phosphatidyl-myo-inositol alpha-mannosyltransferase